MSVVDIIDKIYKKVGIPQHSVSELIDLTKDDSSTWDIYEKGLTAEINQCTSAQSTKSILLQTKKYRRFIGFHSDNQTGL